MFEVQLTNELKVVSFKQPIRKSKLQIMIIVSLIKRKIEDGQAITVDDIMDAHAEYQMKAMRNGSGKIPVYENGRWVRWRIAKTFEEWRSLLTYPPLSVKWFSQYLGESIIHGKMVCIPIIEVENPEC